MESKGKEKEKDAKKKDQFTLIGDEETEYG